MQMASQQGRGTEVQEETERRAAFTPRTGLLRQIQRTVQKVNLKKATGGFKHQSGNDVLTCLEVT